MTRHLRSRNFRFALVALWLVCLTACTTRGPEQSPALTVRSDLPPLALRLPENPEVIMPLENPGVYGGTLHSALLPDADQNGILRFVAQGLTRWDPQFDHVVPNIASAWTHNDDNTEFVFTLRAGMHWSDGTAFNADDIIFAVNDVLANRQIFRSVADRYQAKGQIMRAEKIDATHVRLRFAAGNRLFAEELAGPYGHHPVIYPRHYCSRFHIDYNAQADAEAKAAGFRDWAERFRRQCSDYDFRWSNPDKPTLDPWVITTPYGKTASSVQLQRNAWFWQIDANGHQLPYIDGIDFKVLPTPEAVLGAASQGAFDLQIRHVSGLRERAALAPLVERGSHAWLQMSEVNASPVGLFLNHSTPNQALRTLFAQLPFKAALSQAIDRRAIATQVFAGAVSPWQVGPSKAHRFYNERLATQYTQLDRDTANRTLDSLGLMQRDGEGYRLLAGKRLRLHTIVNANGTAMIDTLKLIQRDWATIGVELSIEAEDRARIASRAQANDYDISVDALSGGMDPTQNPRAYLAQHPADSRQSLLWARWYDSGGKLGEEPSASMKQRFALWDKWKAARSDEEADQLFRQILDIAAQELEVIGTVSAPSQSGLRSAALRNVPASMPGAWIWPTPGPSLPQQYYFAK